MPKHEHTSPTDAALEHMADQDNYPGFSTLTAWVARDLREARRLLRAVEWEGATREESACPLCGALEHDFAAPRDHKDDCDLGRYLYACEGKEQR